MIGSRCKKLCRVAVAVMAVSLPMAFATGASAFTEPGVTISPADFTNCPLQALGGQTSLATLGCVHAYTTGGTFQIGHATVPISLAGDTIDMAFVAPEFPICEEYASSIGYSFGRQEGCTVSGPHGILNGPAQPAPGGLLGSVGDSRSTAVTAKLEWVTSTPNTVFGIWDGEDPVGLDPVEDPHGVLDQEALLDGVGAGIVLTAKIHLFNPFLGPNCYIGSSFEPDRPEVDDRHHQPTCAEQADQRHPGASAQQFTRNNHSACRPRIAGLQGSRQRIFGAGGQRLRHFLYRRWSAGRRDRPQARVALCRRSQHGGDRNHRRAG